MNRYYNTIIQGNVLEKIKDIPDGIVQTCITSPPYFGLRNYGVDGQLGLEKTPEEYVAKMVEVFREVRRVLREDGTLWLNLGDSYNSAASGQNGKTGTLDGGKSCGGDGTTAGRQPLYSGLKPKDLCMIPARVALALQADGWYLRSEIIWAKPNPMPESVTDRPTKAHEIVYLLSKKPKYYYDAEAIKEDATECHKPGRNSRKYQDRDPNHSSERKDRKSYDPSSAGGGTNVINHSGNSMTVGGKKNKRSVWTVVPKAFKEAHFATFPPDLIRPCVLAGCPVGGLVLDPFMGAGTTALVACLNNRNFLGIELNQKYIDMSWKRLEIEITKYLNKKG